MINFLILYSGRARRRLPIHTWASLPFNYLVTIFWNADIADYQNYNVFSGFFILVGLLTNHWSTSSYLLLNLDPEILFIFQWIILYAGEVGCFLFLFVLTAAQQVFLTYLWLGGIYHKMEMPSQILSAITVIGAFGLIVVIMSEIIPILWAKRKDVGFHHSSSI